MSTNNLSENKKKAAEYIIDKMEGPDRLLTFLTFAISCVADHTENNKHKRDAIQFLTNWIDEIVNPWGFAKNKASDQVVIVGIDNIFDFWDCEGYMQANACILAAVGKELIDFLPFIQGYHCYSDGLNVLMEVGACAYYHEKENKKPEKEVA